MDGPHDLGGAHGLGSISPTPAEEEPVFHADWERDTLAMTLAAAALGQWNIDMVRHARERQHPVAYLRNSYYENWLAGLELLLVETGVLTNEELVTGTSNGLACAALRERVPTATQAVEALVAGSDFERTLQVAPRFQVDDRVRVVVMHPSGHTRSPRYVRGRAGTVHEHYGGHVFPDANAAGTETGVHLYGVRFEAEALWGNDAAGKDAVYVDLWETYLEPE